MSNDFAKFQATLSKVNFNGKKTVVTLELDNRTAAANIEFLMGNIDDTVNVNLGDPQMKLDLPPGDRQGVTATIGADGVVESVKAEEDDEEGEQAEFDIEGDQGEEEPNYEGKAILFNKGEEGQIVFPIENGFARSPQITKTFGVNTYTHTMGAGEVEKEVGVRELPISETDGKDGCYLISELLAFGGELVDAPESEDDELECSLQDEAEWSNDGPLDEDMDFVDEEEEQAS